MNSARNLMVFGLKSATKCCCRQTQPQSLYALRCMSATPAAVPQADGEPKMYAPKIEKLVSEISGLTLLEVTDLSELLKKRLNLPDAPAVSFAAGPLVAAQGQGAAQAEDDKPAKSLKTVKMTGFDEKQKVGIIKFMRSIMEDMNLVQAKKFVESAPVLIKGDLLQEEAEKLKKELEAVGATVTIE